MFKGSLKEEGSRGVQARFREAIEADSKRFNIISSYFKALERYQENLVEIRCDSNSYREVSGSFEQVIERSEMCFRFQGDA